MQHVDVWQPGERRRHPVQREPRFNQRQVKRLAVVGDDRAERSGHVADRFEQRTLGGEVSKERTAGPETCRRRTSAQPTRNA